MLKPKRKTTKEEIKKDSFVETVFNFINLKLIKVYNVKTKKKNYQRSNKE